MKTSPTDRLVEQRTRKLRIVNDALAARYANRSCALRCMASTNDSAKKIFGQRLLSEWPVAVATLDIPSARGCGKRIGDAVRSELQALAKLWKE